MFLIGNILRNLITALEFPDLKWFLIYRSQHGKYWFSHIYTVTSKPFSLLDLNCDFLVTLNISNQIHLILCPKLIHFFEKIHKIFKKKVQGCSIPLNYTTFLLIFHFVNTYFLSSLGKTDTLFAISRSITYKLILKKVEWKTRAVFMLWYMPVVVFISIFHA